MSLYWDALRLSALLVRAMVGAMSMVVIVIGAVEGIANTIR